MGEKFAFSCLLLGLSTPWSIMAFCHSGGLDDSGGHKNRKTGVYHCHREPCMSKNQTLSLAGESKPSQFSKYSRDDWKHWVDADNDCMNTRHYMLLSQADGDVKLSPDGCYVNVGT